MLNHKLQTCVSLGFFFFFFVGDPTSIRDDDNSLYISECKPHELILWG